MTQAEYIKRYRDQMVKQGVLPGSADELANAVDFEDLDGDYSHPEEDADDELSNWENDGDDQDE